MSWSHSTVAGRYNHSATTMKHIPAHIIQIRTRYIARPSYHDVIGRVYAVTASAVCAEQIVPSITIDQVGSLTVDSDIYGFVTFYTLSRFRIQFHDPDITEVCAVRHPQATCRRVEHQSRVDGVVILHTIRGSYLYRF